MSCQDYRTTRANGLSHNASQISVTPVCITNKFSDAPVQFSI